MTTIFNQHRLLPATATTVDAALSIACCALLLLFAPLKLLHRFQTAMPCCTHFECSPFIGHVLQTEIEAIRDDIAPTWLQRPLSLEQTADKYVRPSLQQVNNMLCFPTIMPSASCLASSLSAQCTCRCTTLHKVASKYFLAIFACYDDIVIIVTPVTMSGCSADSCTTSHVSIVIALQTQVSDT